MNRLLPACLLAATAALAGCQNGGMSSLFSGQPGGVTKIDRVQFILTPPAPVNWDSEPGLDGFLARVYCWRMDEKLAVPVDGTLEMVLYEGRLSAGELAGKEPFQTWTLKDSQLEACLGKSLFGWGYSLELGWGKHVPTAATVTLIARHRSARGVVTASEPMNVAMGPM
jgi:hypothetical protein